MLRLCTALREQGRIVLSSPARYTAVWLAEKNICLKGLRIYRIIIVGRLARVEQPIQVLPDTYSNT
jgi:hypothetical protein